MTSRLVTRLLLGRQRAWSSLQQRPGSSSSCPGGEDSWEARPLHEATGTFGSLTSVLPEDRQFLVEAATCTERRATQQEPLVIIFGWAGATHKVGLVDIIYN